MPAGPLFAPTAAPINPPPMSKFSLATSVNWSTHVGSCLGGLSKPLL